MTTNHETSNDAPQPPPHESLRPAECCARCKFWSALDKCQKELNPLLRWHPSSVCDHFHTSAT